MAEGTSRVIAGRYRLVGRLGHGGMGVVWQARDELLGRDVAVKEIRVSVPDEAVDLLARRALREARAAASLRHPGIVMVHDVVTDDGRPWIVMELIRGRSLAQVIDVDGPLSARQAADVGRQVLDALGAAHRRGILHRDVKPANILLDGDRAVLTDFGIAAIDGATALTATGLLIGSPDYLAPERINGCPATTAVDMWGLGVTLYTAVAGLPPFHREDTQSTLAAVLVSDPKPLDSAPELWPVVRGLLAKTPETRLALTAAIPLLAAAVGLPPTAPPSRRRWTAIFPGRSRVGAASPLASSPDDRAGEHPPAAPTAAGAPAGEQAEPPPTATMPVARPPVPPADSGPPVAVRARSSRTRTITLIAASALVLLLPGPLGWLAQRGPEDPAEPRAAVSSLAGAGDRTTSPSPSSTTPPAPAGFELARGSGWTIIVPNSFNLVSANQWGGFRRDKEDRDVWFSVTVSKYARNDRTGADEELIANERSLKSDAYYAEYKRLRLNRRLPAAEGAGSVAEIEYTRVAKPPKVKSNGLARPTSLGPVRDSGRTIGLHSLPAANALRFDLGVEPEGPEEVPGAGLELIRGIVHLWRYSRSIDRAFVTQEGTGSYVVSVRVAADTSDGRRRFWPKERSTITTILNSFRFTSSRPPR